MKPLLYVVGDSISMHYGPYLERFLEPRFSYGRKSGVEGNLDLPTALTSENGGDSSMVLEYLNYLSSIDFRSEVLLLNCGLHDIKLTDGAYQVPLENYERNLREIIPIWRAMCAQPVWVRTTAVDDEAHARNCSGFARFDVDVDRYNACADAVMRENQIPILDLNSFTSTLKNPYCDHVHFHEEARSLQAAFLAGAIFSLVAN